MVKKNYEIKAFDPHDDSIAKTYFVENVNLSCQQVADEIYKKIAADFNKVYPYSDGCWFAYNEISEIPDGVSPVTMTGSGDNLAYNR